MAARGWSLALAAVVAACGGAPAFESGVATSTSDASSTGASIGATDSGTATTSTSALDTTSDDPTSGFLPPPDGESPFECSVFEQDCPRGQKCAAWADGAQGWNATKCVPVDPDPVAVGEACTTQGSSTSGIDDCEHGALCWFHDEQLQGTCLGYCQGSARAPICPAGHQCLGDAALCLPQCDPLGDDCGPGVCIPSGSYWECVPDASARGASHGTSCELINECPAGMLCIESSFHGSCDGTSCCSTFCSLDALDVCPSLDPEQSCQPYYLRGMAPPGYENVGVCAVP